MKNKNYVVVTHQGNLYGSAHYLVEYLLKKAKTVLVIRHPFPDYKGDKHSTMELYIDGSIVKKKNIKNYYPSDAINHLLNIHYTIKTVISVKRKMNLSFDAFIGVNCFNASIGVILSRLGYIRKSIFYAVDFTHKRYENPIMNFFYKKTELFSTRFSDLTWNVSHRMAQERLKQGVKKNRNKVIPNGCWFINENSKKRIGNSLLFSGHLTESKGVQEIIAIMPRIVKTSPKTTLTIVGTGPYEDQLKKQVSSLGMNKKESIT